MSAIDRRTGLTGATAIKQPCRVATTANITLSGEQTIDGVAVVADDRVLARFQTAGADNGIYIVATSGWQRAPDFNGARDVVQGTMVYVNAGSLSAGITFRLTTANPIVVGTTSLTFASLGAGLFTAFATQAQAELGTSTTEVMNPLRTWDAIRVVTTHIDIRETRFAGGAPLNGIDDDTPAIQAAIDYYKPYGQYTGTGIPISLGGRGEPRIDSASINLTNCHGIDLFGAGYGATHLKGSGNRPIITWTNVSALPLTNTRLRDFTLYGAGDSNTSLDGILGGATNNCEYNGLRVWGCRRGMALANQYLTKLINVRIDGIGSTLRCYDGLVMLDGEAAVVENALDILDGMIGNTQRYGLWGQSVTGTNVEGLRVIGTGSTGVLLESPTGKDLKWFNWTGGEIDTCPDLLSVKKTSSAIAQLINFSDIWISYASGSPDGTAVEFDGIDNFYFSAKNISNCVYAMNIANCTRANINIGQIYGYDRLVAAAAGVVVNNTVDSVFRLGSMVKASGASSVLSLEEQGTSARNDYSGFNADGLVSLIGGNGSTGQGRHVISSTSRLMSRADQVYTMATLPTASSVWKDQTVTASDETGGYTLLFCDGTNWRRVQDRAIAS